MEKKEPKKRNRSLNILKGIASFCVVMIHFSLPGNIGRIVHGISNFAVPFFFTVSGYFVYRENNSKVIHSLPAKVKHIAGILLWTELLYFVWHIMWGGGEWLKITFNVQNVINLIMFQTTFIGNVSWFLVALLLCYGVTFFIAKYNFWKKCIGFIILISVHILLGRIGSLQNIEIPWYWCSNFWFLGFPCYVIGFIIRIYEKKILKFVTIGRFFWLIMGTGILTIVEVMLIGENQCCLSNILFMICCFIFALKYPEGFKNGIMKCLDYIGEKYSLGIYILHPIVGEMISSIAGRVGFGGMAIWKWCFPISVIIFSMFMWKLWSIVHNKCWRYISYDFMG